MSRAIIVDAFLFWILFCVEWIVIFGLQGYQARKDKRFYEQWRKAREDFAKEADHG